MSLKSRKAALLGIAWVPWLVWMMAPGSVLAKSPPDKVVIRVPGLSREVEITDPQVLPAFSFFGFEDITRRVDPPPHSGKGVIITRYIREGGKWIPWDRLIYYPPRNGASGVVFLEGLIGPGSTQFDGLWYSVSPEGDRAMRRILQEWGVWGPAPIYIAFWKWRARLPE